MTLAANVQPSQAALVEARPRRPGTPTVTVAMRTPYDLAAYPGSATHLCSYAIVPCSVVAVADALFGRAPDRRPAARGDPRALSSRARHGGALMGLVDEIREQPEVAARLLREAGPEVAAICEAIRAAEPTHIVIAARGTSDHAAIYAQYAMGIRRAGTSAWPRRACTRSTARPRIIAARSSSASASRAPPRTSSASSALRAPRAP